MSGRKERYGPEAYAAVIKDIAAGIPLASCLGGRDRPGRTSFYARLKEDSQLAADYETAMQSRAEAQVDALMDVNQRLLEGRIDPQSARVLSDNLKWLSSKSNPRLYGDKNVTELTGRDGAPLLAQPQMDDLELARFVSFIMGKGMRAGAIDQGDLLALPIEVIPMTPHTDPALQSAVARVVTAFSACSELAARDGLTLEFAAFARALRHPAIGLTADQRRALDNATERELVGAFWREFSARRASGELPQPAQAAQSH